VKHIASLFVVLLLIGCTGTKAVYNQASTPVQYAKAVLLHHNALGAEAVSIVNDPAVSAVTKDKVRAAYRVTVCSPEEVQVKTPTADCDAGPAYVLDGAIIAFDVAGNAQTEAEVTAAANAFIPLVTALIRAIN
jgi:hypothetical protein